MHDPIGHHRFSCFQQSAQSSERYTPLPIHGKKPSLDAVLPPMACLSQVTQIVLVRWEPWLGFRSHFKSDSLAFTYYSHSFLPLAGFLKNLDWGQSIEQRRTLRTEPCFFHWIIFMRRFHGGSKCTKQYKLIPGYEM